MAVVTLPQFKAALSAGSSLGARTAANLADERLTAALDEAHDEVLGKLSTLYTLPVDEAAGPAIVRSLILNVAAYVATLEWLQGKELPERDPIVLRYQRAQKMLREVVDGTLVVDGLEKAGAGAPGAIQTFDSVPYVGLAEPAPGGYYYGTSYRNGGLLWDAT